MFTGPRPAELHPFRELAGARHRAVATPGDLLFHIRAGQMDLCFELATQIMERLAGSVTVCDEVHGFRYFDERDLVGFVDGTENPTGQAAATAAITGTEDPGFAGGSYVIVQKYLHDLTAWNRLTVEDQEKVIGRTKLSDIETRRRCQARQLPRRPEHHHRARRCPAADPAGQHAVRHCGDEASSAPTSSATAATPGVTEQMLQNMFIGNPPGNYDRILDFSTAVTGNLFFAPSAGFLDDLPALPAPSSSAATLPATADGSLGIGGLNRSSQL